MTVATSQPLPTTVQADPPPDPVVVTAPRPRPGRGHREGRGGIGELPDLGEAVAVDAPRTGGPRWATGGREGVSLDVGAAGGLDDVADPDLLVARQVLGELLGRRGPRGREGGGPREAPRRGVGIEPRGDLRVVALRPGEVVGVELGDPEVRPVVGLDGAERVEAVGAQVVLEPRHRARGQGARWWCRQVGERQEGHRLDRHRARRQHAAAPSEAARPTGGRAGGRPRRHRRPEGPGPPAAPTRLPTA